MTNDPVSHNDPYDGAVRAVPMGHGPRRAAPPGGADRAISAGRRRIHRRRAAGTAAGFSFAVVAGAALADRPGERSGLSPTGPIATGTSAGQPPARSTPTPTASLPLPGVPSGVPGLPFTPGDPTAQPTETAPEPSAEPTGARGWIGQTDGRVRITSKNDPAACAAVPDQADDAARSGFCTILTGPTQVTRGKPVDISVSLCRPGGMPARTVTYESDYEVVINVAKHGPKGEIEQWAWAHPEDFAPERRTVTFNGGDCRTWTASWAGQGNDAFALDAGHYQVNGYPVAFDWTHEDGDDARGPMPVFYTVELR